MFALPWHMPHPPAVHGLPAQLPDRVQGPAHWSLSGGRSVSSSIAWTSTCPAPGVRAWRASKSTLEYWRRHTGETRCLGTRTAQSTSFAREVCVGPHRARTAASSSRATSREPTCASSTPYIGLARASIPMAIRTCGTSAGTPLAAKWWSRRQIAPGAPVRCLFRDPGVPLPRAA